MPDQPRQHVLAVLPYGLAHHQRRLLRDGAKHLVAVLLAVDEPVLPLRIVRVRALDPPAFRADRQHHGLFGLLLGLPAHAVRRRSQVAIRYEIDEIGHEMPTSTLTT